MSLFSPSTARRRGVALSLALGIAASATLLSGCSKSSSSQLSGQKLVPSSHARELLVASKESVKGAGSVQVKGLIVAGGSAMTVDWGVGAQNAGGTVEVDGAVAEARVVNGGLYLKGDPAFWDALHKGVGAGFGGSWVRVSASTGPQFAALLALVPPSAALDNLAPSNSSWTEVPGRKLDGVETLGVRDTQSGHGNTVYIAKEKPGRPLGVELAKGGLVTFSQWGKPVKAPAAPPEPILDATGAKLADAVLPQG